MSYDCFYYLTIVRRREGKRERESRNKDQGVEVRRSSGGRCPLGEMRSECGGKKARLVG